jgi:zinc-binding alcohol dehydrogenase/oxidoreductase
VTGSREGDAVVITPALSLWTCAYCLAGQHSLCDQLGTLGGPSDGTLAEYVTVPAWNLAPKPAHLSFAQAAALPLALVTAWRAPITRGRLQAGETVLIHGMGGGAAAGIDYSQEEVAALAAARASR